MKKVFVGILCISVCLSGTFNIFATKLSTIKNEKTSVDKKRANITSQKKSEEIRLNGFKKNISTLDKENEQLNKRVQELVKDKNLKEIEIKTLDDGLMDAETRYDDALAVFKKRLRAIYMTSDDNMITLFLRSDDMSEFYDRYEIMNGITRKNKEIVEEFIAAKKDLEYKKEKLEEEKFKTQKKISDSKGDIDVIKTSRSETEDKLRAINSKIKKLKSQEGQLLNESKKLSSKIKQLQSSTAKYSGGKLKWTVPSTSRISSYYGMRTHPVLKYKRMHTGIDVAGRYGVSIVAANSGVVRGAGWEGGYGRTVIIDHGGGVTTLYAHTSKVLVKKGQRVKAGQTIAKVGSTGLSTGPHLHFEVRVNGSPVNPMKYYK